MEVAQNRSFLIELFGRVCPTMFHWLSSLTIPLQICTPRILNSSFHSFLLWMAFVPFMNLAFLKCLQFCIVWWPYIELYLQTVDQFFGLNLPMDITHLQALLSVIFHSLDTYLQKVISELG